MTEIRHTLAEERERDRQRQRQRQRQTERTDTLHLIRNGYQHVVLLLLMIWILHK